MTESIDLKHDSQRTAWANATDRTKVFSVARPNPEHAEWLKRKSAAEIPSEDGSVVIFDDVEPPRELVTEYTMPAKPNAGIALQYLKQARANADMAASWLLELALGSDGYDALTEELATEEDPEKASETMTAVVKFVAQRALGGLSGKA